MKLLKVECSRCGGWPVVHHHEDYEKPHDTVMLCYRCHYKRHMELGWGIRGNPHPSKVRKTFRVIFHGSQMRDILLLAKANGTTPTYEVQMAVEAHIRKPRKKKGAK